MSVPELMSTDDAVHVQSAVMDVDGKADIEVEKSGGAMDIESDTLLDSAMSLASLCPNLELEMLKKLVSCTANVEEAAQVALLGPQEANAFIDHHTQLALHKDSLRANLAACGVDMDELAAHAQNAEVPVDCAFEMALAQVGAAAAASLFRHLYSQLTASACAVLVAAEGGGVKGYRAAAALALRHKVWQCRNKEQLYHKRYTRERSEAAMQRWVCRQVMQKAAACPKKRGTLGLMPSITTVQLLKRRQRQQADGPRRLRSCGKK